MTTGRKKQCNFKYEDQVDLFLARMQQEFPEIKTVSEAAEKRLEEAERAREQKPEVPLCGMALKEVERLECAKEYLEKQPVLFAEFSNAARKKRTYEQTKPYYKWGALLFTVLGIAALVSGLASLKSQAPFAVWFVLFGIAGIFLFPVPTSCRPAGITGRPLKNVWRRPRRRWQSAKATAPKSLRFRPAICIRLPCHA